MNSPIPHIHVIARPRLLNKLASAVEHRLTIISAPPGYGKTTLAAQFARQSPVPLAWHSIEMRERDLTNLHDCSVAALGEIMPTIQAVQQPPHSPPGELAALLAEQLRNDVGEDILFVLDDVQHLDAAPAAETWLRTLVETLPRNCHLILISRTLPGIPLHELLGRSEVLMLGAADLRLTAEEIDQLATELLGKSAPVAKQKAIATRLDGWPAGTVLALDLSLIKRSGERWHSYGEPEAMFHALAEAMLARQPPDIQAFLRASSCLSKVTPQLCADALHLATSDALLAEVEERQLFMHRVSGGLAYHTLFKDFLQEQLRTVEPGLFVTLHDRAARYFEACDNIDEAMAHNLAAGLADSAARLAEEAATTYYLQGRFETLLLWEHQLRQINGQSANLLYHCALIHMARYAYDEAETQLREAMAVYQHARDSVGLRNVELQQSALALYRGRYQDAVMRATALLQIGGSSEKTCLPALHTLGVAYLYLGETTLAERCLNEALPFYRAHADTYSLSQLLQSLSMAYSRLGRLADSSACLQEVVALRRSLGGAQALAAALNNLGYAYHRASEYHQAFITLQEGLDLVARFPDRRAETALLWSLGDVQRDIGYFGEARRLYRRALDVLGDGEPALRCGILISLSTLRCWEARWADAVSVASTARALAEKHDMVLEQYLADAVLWCARMYDGAVREAIQRLIAIADGLSKREAHFERMVVLGMVVEAALVGSKLSLTRRCWRMALEVAEALGTAQPLAAQATHSPILSAYLTDSEAPAFRRDLKRLKLVQAEMPREQRHPSRPNDRLPYALRVLTLGQKTVVRDGRVLRTSAWRASNALAMFFSLLFLGPRRREAICLDFWPDSSTQRVRSNFHTILYHARLALGAEAITFQDDRYRIDPSIVIWCDALEFERLIGQARSLPLRDARTETLWRKAVDLYHGDFLSTFDTEWIVTYREQLTERFMEALVGLGACERQRGAVRTALETYRRALEVDPYREDIHRAVIACYVQQGESHKARLHFEALQQRLRSELAVEPSQETLDLMKTLVL